jgi:N-methylhydantoinase B
MESLPTPPVRRERLLELVDRYGADTTKAAMHKQMNDAERKLRAKLEQIPDGTWSAASHQEQSGTGDRNGRLDIALVGA